MQAGGGKMAYNHGGRLRWNHLAGMVVAGMTVVGATNAEIQTGNVQRFRDLDDTIRSWFHQLYLRVTTR